MEKVVAYLESKNVEVDLNKFTVLNNGDGLGPQLVDWKYVSVARPTQEELDALPADQVEQAFARRRLLESLQSNRLPVMTTNQVTRLTPRLKAGMLWFNSDLKKLQCYDESAVLTL